MLADNRTTRLGADNDSLLAGLLLEIKTDVGDLIGTGFDDDFFQDLMHAQGLDTPGLTDEDAVPEPPAEPVSRMGDLWVLSSGNGAGHRLLCGDSTKADDVARLMGGEKADLLVTDEPYGVSYADKNRFMYAICRGNRIQKPIQGDHQDPKEMAAFWVEAFTATRTVMRPGAAYYVTGPQGGDLLLLLQSLGQSGFPLHHMLIWAKNNHVLGRCDYNYKHEPIIYGWVEGAGHKFYGSPSETSLWEIAKPQKSELHPTSKPVALYERAILNSSKAGEIVLDVFGGSGTAVIACEKTKRAARVMEIDCHYTDVICQRFAEFTGKQATLDGRTFSEVKSERVAKAT